MDIFEALNNPEVFQAFQKADESLQAADDAVLGMLKAPEGGWTEEGFQAVVEAEEKAKADFFSAFDVLESLARGLQQAADGELEDLGSFSEEGE